MNRDQCGWKKIFLKFSCAFITNSLSETFSFFNKNITKHEMVSDSFNEKFHSVPDFNRPNGLKQSSMSQDKKLTSSSDWDWVTRKPQEMQQDLLAGC